MADVRLSDQPASVNDRLLDRAIRHSFFLRRVIPGLQRDVLSILGTLDNAFLKRLTTALESASLRDLQRYARKRATTSRGQALRDLVNKVAPEHSAALLGTLTPLLITLGRSEAGFEQKVLQETIPLDIPVRPASNSVLRRNITSSPMDGELLREMTASYGVGKRRRIEQILRQGISEGLTIDQMVRRIRGTKALNFRDGVLDISRRSARGIVQTAASHASNTAREQTWIANSSVIDKIRYVATLDLRTTERCVSLDGTLWPIGEGPRPPQHRNCRSTTVAVTKSWKELGFDFDELDPGTRASMNGQVPEDVVAESWLRSQPREDLIKARGATRTKLFLDGKLPAKRFVNEVGEPWTIEELRTREPGAFERAGL